MIYSLFTVHFALWTFLKKYAPCVNILLWGTVLHLKQYAKIQYGLIQTNNFVLAKLAACKCWLVSWPVCPLRCCRHNGLPWNWTFSLVPQADQRFDLFNGISQPLWVGLAKHFVQTFVVQCILMTVGQPFLWWNQDVNIVKFDANTHVSFRW